MSTLYIANLHIQVSTNTEGQKCHHYAQMLTLFYREYNYTDSPFPHDNSHGRLERQNRKRDACMLADVCAFNNMIIGGSVFLHRRIHKAAWVSPDHRTENQIDHICIGRTFRRSMQDVREQRGADAASDHHLVVARMKMKLKKREVKRSTRTQYNVDFLKDRVTTETFRLTVRNKYEALQDLLDEGNMDIDIQWQQIKETWTSTGSEVLGKKKYQ